MDSNVTEAGTALVSPMARVAVRTVVRDLRHQARRDPACQYCSTSPEAVPSAQAMAVCAVPMSVSAPEWKAPGIAANSVDTATGCLSAAFAGTDVRAARASRAAS
ncbi:hypothetical protein [Streptomyces sp. CFMR 7]|uniref:hypothetical protein n=1 Tax=Streptomyces sp. CFMR 7 TaxID=1649184 RepID=UPI001642DAB5|nr:hypothetical protein [Streptomyces sp. CFMR 7]